MQADARETPVITHGLTSRAGISATS